MLEPVSFICLVTHSFKLKRCIFLEMGKMSFVFILMANTALLKFYLAVTGDAFLRPHPSIASKVQAIHKLEQETYKVQITSIMALGAHTDTRINICCGWCASGFLKLLSCNWFRYFYIMASLYSDLFYICINIRMCSVYITIWTCNQQSF